MGKRSSVSSIPTLQGLGGSGDEHSSREVSIRKIENGYLVRESCCTNGEYRSSERYCAVKPELEVPREPTGAGTEGMREAMKELRRK